MFIFPYSTTIVGSWPIAGMIFLKALTGVEIASCPQIASEDARAERVAIEAVNNAIANPFRVTPSKLKF